MGSDRAGDQAGIAAQEEKRGLRRDDRGVVVPPGERVPYAPENKQLSKAQFVKSQELRRKREAAVKEVEAKLKADHNAEVEKLRTGAKNGETDPRELAKIRKEAEEKAQNLAAEADKLEELHKEMAQEAQNAVGKKQKEAKLKAGKLEKKAAEARRLANEAAKKVELLNEDRPLKVD